MTTTLVILFDIAIIILFVKGIKKRKNNSTYFPNFFSHFSKKKQFKITYPYKKKKLLSNAEFSFYKCLIKAIPDTHTVMSKCRIEDIIYVPKGTSNYMKYRGYIKSRHVDFVICEKKDMQTKLVIELDDKSHKQNCEIDNRKNEILKSAKIPLVRVPAQRTYNIEQIKNEIAKIEEYYF